MQSRGFKNIFVSNFMPGTESFEYFHCHCLKPRQTASRRHHENDTTCCASVVECHRGDPAGNLATAGHRSCITEWYMRDGQGRREKWVHLSYRYSLLLWLWILRIELDVLPDVSRLPSWILCHASGMYGAARGHNGQPGWNLRKDWRWEIWVQMPGSWPDVLLVLVSLTPARSVVSTATRPRSHWIACLSCDLH